MTDVPTQLKDFELKDPKQRVYLPTLAELIDRLSIVQLKAIFISEHKIEYDQEIKLIEHDIDLVLEQKGYKLTAADVRTICMIMLTNHFIWSNESKAREGGDDCDRLLKLTHSINGARNTAKNVLARSVGDRKDYKIDSFAASLEEEFGNWKVFE